MVKLNAIWIQWRKNMKTKVVVDVTYVQDWYFPGQANLVVTTYASSEGSGSPEPPLLAQTRNESRGTFRQKARSLAPLNRWAWADKILHDGMLEDTNSLDAAHMPALV